MGRTKGALGKKTKKRMVMLANRKPKGTKQVAKSLDLSLTEIFREAEKKSQLPKFLAVGFKGFLEWKGGNHWSPAKK